MAFPSSTANQSPLRAALYLRVSTGRQAAGDVSLPSQRELTRRYCESRGWIVTREYLEPGASATDDRRPEFQQMLEDARGTEKPFDVIVVHSFSRFYRNGAEMELTIRRLRKHGVEVVSVTQPTGDDPSQELMRQIIGIFDEYSSRENGKNVTRAMRENAKQGFWNGATPPLGYRVVEVERRGAKAKKRLEIDPVDAETVLKIFKLYVGGDGTSRPLGVKDVTKWLNANGYRTRKGAAFGVGPVHNILTNRAYVTGKWPYGRRNSRTGQQHDPASIIEIDVPPLVSSELFDAVQAKLARNNPKVTPPRVVNSPVLLGGLAVCASCGSAMTRSGTRRHGKNYTYYSCGACQRSGKSICKGRHVPMEKLDSLVLDGICDKVLVPERVERILSALMERNAQRDATVVERRRVLQVELDQLKEKLARLYRAIEDGIVEPDHEVKERIAALKARRQIVETSIDRIVEHSLDQSAITPEKIGKFSTLLRHKLSVGDVQARKDYLRTVIDRIEVDDTEIRIMGRKMALAAAVANPDGQVRGFVRKWRTRQDSNL